MKSRLTHLDRKGKARMVDISKKSVTDRAAVAQAVVIMTPEVIALIKNESIPKGDVLTVATCAGIMAAKKTGSLIPLCHPLRITHVRIEFNLHRDRITITSRIKTSDKTGVEMEALTAVTVAALTVYDMCKAVYKGTVISDVFLLKKTGGKSGKYVRK
jgi:cyclic pyranopterin phosphate synthase